jgi:uncharacterized protein YndB with AHSA1/START domain
MTWSIESIREAPVPPEAVYRFYIDPSTWGRWGHNTRWARADEPVTEGSVVHVKAGYGVVYPVRILQLVPDRLVVCEVRPRGLLVKSSFEVTPADAGARLRHTIEVQGRVAGLARRLGFSWLYRRLLAKETRKLVALAVETRPRAGKGSPS